MTISVIIPSCNAGEYLQPLLSRLREQTLPPDEILVVDSASTDGTAALAESLGARVISIPRESFDHGGTRHMAAMEARGDVLLFLTQDAMPADDSYIRNLVAPFQDDAVAAVGGRQVAREDARPFEKEVRAFNYPAESRVWDASAISERGVKAFFISDVCAAYRRSAYEAVGGFRRPLMTNEDMLMAAALLDAGWKLAYQAEAAVYHSHRFTLSQEYRRNRLIGRVLERYSAELHHARETGEGLRLVKHVLKQLLRKGHVLECFAFCMNCGARLLGNRAGRRMERKAMEHAAG